MQPQRLSILGVGLLGGSIGLAVRPLVKGCRIVGYGHRPATLRTALEVGAIDEAYDDPAAAVRGADLVILCTPVGLFEELLARIAPALDRRADGRRVLFRAGAGGVGRVVRPAEVHHDQPKPVGRHRVGRGVDQRAIVAVDERTQRRQPVDPPPVQVPTRAARRQGNRRRPP